MRTFNKIDAILSLVPTAQIIAIDGVVEWINPSKAPITDKQIQDEISRLQAEYDAKQYQRQRVKEYPPLAELADAIYWQTEGDETKMTAYLAKVEAVKQKYPKE
jgi:hypothetical protein